MQHVIIFFFAILLLGCEKNDGVSDLISIPSHFPAIEYPADNLPSRARLKLGERLFFDKNLSLDSTISCASCHLTEYAFSDTIPLSIGVAGAFGTRNAPSILNAAYLPLLNKDGGVKKLDLFALVPIEDHAEMNINPLDLGHRLAENPELQAAAKAAYNRPMDSYVITRALGTYVRSLISGDSKYDDYLQGKIKLGEAEERGRLLFHSDKAKCSSCHEGIFLTNNKYENNGTKELYKDQGRKLITGNESDRATYRVASLRNVELTAPYMHDGSFSSLEDVINHYSDGVIDHRNKSPLIKALHLSELEKADLLAFLKTLTDKKYKNY